MKSDVVDFLKKHAVKLLFLFVLGIYLSFALSHLTKFETADEHYWFNNAGADRIHQYWSAVQTKNWIYTRINDKPGVSLAYVSGFALLFEKDPQKIFSAAGEGWRIFDQNKYQEINFLFRFPIVVFTALAGSFFFWVIRRITKNEWLALFAASAIVLSPPLVGISQIVNPDSMLWIFSFASFLPLLLFLEEKKRWQAIMAAFAFGMALLSKYAALMLVPFFFAVSYLKIVYANIDGEELIKTLKTYALGYFTVVIGGILVFAILMPAVIIDPILAYKSTIGFNGMEFIFWPLMALNLLILLDAVYNKGSLSRLLLKNREIFKKYFPRALYALLALLFILTLVNWMFGKSTLGVPSVAFDTGKGKTYAIASVFDKTLLQLRPIVFSLTPLILLSIIALWIKSAWKRSKQEYLILILSLFVVLFYAAVAMQGLLITIRYGIILYPVLMLLAALGIWELFDLEHKKTRCKLAIFTALIAANVASLWLISPFYFNYTNDLMPKDNSITGAWGYGGYEAAQYLNALPNAEKLTVWADYPGVCPFFKGKCINGLSIKAFLKKNDYRDIDYMVATRRGMKQSKLNWNSFNIYDADPVWTYYIDGRGGNFLKIYVNDKQLTKKKDGQVSQELKEIEEDIKDEE